MRQSVNIFSKLFSSPTVTNKHPDRSKHIKHLQTIFAPEAEFFTQLPIFNNRDKKNIDYLMIHPKMGVILLNYFDYSLEDLKGVTVSLAQEKDTNPDIKTSEIKKFLMQRFDDVFNTQLSPIRSILICSKLTENEFDSLDESFHLHIPKHSTLFCDANDTVYKDILLNKENEDYDLEKIKRALFPELVVAKTRSLMTNEQTKIMHTQQSENILVHGLPGSGKSSTLIAKALYEKMKKPELELIILGKRVCNVHQLQALIFSFIENSHWALNPADITVSSFETIKKRCSEKENYDLIVCDDMNEEDMPFLLQLLNKKGKLLASSHYHFKDIKRTTLYANFRLSPALCAACEGLEVDHLEQSLSRVSGNIFMNAVLTLSHLLKEVDPNDITIVHENKEELLTLQTEIDTFFSPISYLFDTSDKKEGIALYPMSHIPCLLNKYMIIIIDENSIYDPIELISRARHKTFILSQSEEVYNIIQTIKEHITHKES